jgi:hypothetical protein
MCRIKPERSVFLRHVTQATVPEVYINDAAVLTGRRLSRNFAVGVSHSGSVQVGAVQRSSGLYICFVFGSSAVNLGLEVD